jgi:hypothetical protein
MSTLNHLIREGFQVLAKDFTLPENAPSLEPKTKRQVTICNLFVNHHLPIVEIARVLVLLC